MAHRQRYGLAGILYILAALALLAAAPCPAGEAVSLTAAFEAAANQQWQRAQRIAHTCRDESPEELASLLQTCRLQIRLEERYRDGSLAQWMRDLQRRDARDLIESLCDRVYSRSLAPPERDAWTAAALDVLAAAARNALVYRQWGLSDLQAANLARRLQRLAQAAPPDPDELLQQLERLAPELDLPQGWAGVSLAAALAEALDEYSYLLGPRECDRFYSRIGGAYVGIGVDLRFADAWPRVFDVIENSPAHLAGVRPGDLLVAIADQPLRDLNEARVAQLLAGPSGKALDLTLRRPDYDLTVQLARKVVAAPSVRQACLVDSSKGLAAVRVASFDRDTAMELCRAVQGLCDLGATRLVLDLRCNGGGMLSSAVDAARLFVDRGPLVTVESRQSQRLHEATGEARFDMPVIILVDETTASAAEIFTAALQQHRRAQVVGLTTRGKGLVQTVAPIDGTPAALCMTTARYLDPTGRCLHRDGVHPDLRVPEAQRDSVDGWLTPTDPFFPSLLAALDQPETLELVHAR